MLTKVLNLITVIAWDHPKRDIGVETAMNNMQRIVFVVAILVITVMCVYPPWVLTYDGAEYSLGFGLITKPPLHRNGSTATVTLDQKRLSAQCAIAGIVSLSLIWILKSTKLQASKETPTHWRTK